MEKSAVIPDLGKLETLDGFLKVVRGGLMEVGVVVVVVGDTSETPGRVRISWKIFSLFLGKRKCDSKIDNTTAKEILPCVIECEKTTTLHTCVSAHQSSLVCHLPPYTSR